MRMGGATVARAAGVSRRTLERWLAGPTAAEARAGFDRACREQAAASLRGRGIVMPRELRAVLRLYTNVSQD